MPAPDTSATGITGYRWALHTLAILLALSTFMLIGFGGHVTSLDAGLAVPDWPGTFGYNMFMAPLDVWFFHEDTGRFWEHAHRLIAAIFVGPIGGILGLWLAFSPRGKWWLRLLGISIAVLVIAQALMGGFRVTEISTFLAFLHGVVGQLFFAIVIFAVVATGPLWARRAPKPASERTYAGGFARFAAWGLVGTLVIQLALGAAVRHYHAERAIPDAPLSYGALVPPMNQAQLDKAILALPENLVDRVPPQTTAGDVHLHFTHRAWAVVVCVVAVFAGWLSVVALGGRGEVFAPLLYVGCLLAAQVMVGIMTVWAEINPSFATLHQSLGALVLASCVWFACRVHIVSALEDPGRRRQQEPEKPEAAEREAEESLVASGSAA
ncbi:COX15/CtaA family protein [Mucisphaera calidilacus]|uniref:Heme A synthase n=1 Tax=Mucisphaera calidilacus TaxID=2527982 RepID=A0A518BV49_9BACT|nr:COX15/CtaA family protein [Mucisphaera calidilacus]QDU70863.1 Heme A synthase [Mucisphaera calidilacus]